MVGFGAAAYSPAKYGILTELLPPRQLVVANGWIEGTTVGSIILGVLLGGALISPKVSTMLLGFDLPCIDTGIDTPPEAAICVIMPLLRRSPPSSTGSFRTPASITGCEQRTRCS